MPEAASADAEAEVSSAAQALDRLRTGWLNPDGMNDGELAKRTLTNLYNQRPTWLDQAHLRLDQAVYAVYGWEYPLPDDEVLSRLLELNLTRSGDLTLTQT